jgi:hypothetical protein
MSHSHVRVPKQTVQPPRRRWLDFVLVGVIALILIAATLVARMSSLDLGIVHEITQGNILETRVDVVDLGSNRYGGYIRSQIMARVSYQNDNGTQDRWMPTSEVSNSRRLLEVRLEETPPKLCRVYWVVGHPGNPRCQIEWPTRQ